MTYFSYYGQNITKGGIFLHLSGWLGDWTLWTGSVLDTHSFNNSGLLEEQKCFQNKDTINKFLTFINILDKGYRSVLAAWRAGGQLLLQPFFRKSDRQFSSKEILLSAVVASDQSGNEKAVKRMKLSGMIA